MPEDQRGFPGDAPDDDLPVYELPGDEFPGEALGIENPIRRINETTFSLEMLHPAISELVGTLARTIAASTGEPGSPGYEQLFGQIEEDADLGDPLITLERQMRAESVCTLAEKSVGQTEISQEEAEAWLSVLGMAVRKMATALDIRTEADLEALGAGEPGPWATLQVLQVLLVDALQS